MLKLELWVVVALVVGLSSAQAWACPSRGSEKKLGGHGSSIRLTTAKRADLSFLSQRAVEVPVLSKHLAGSRGGHAARRHEHSALTGHGKGHAGRGRPSSPRPSVQAAAPMPEPSALMCFGVGLLMARRAVGRKRGTR